MSPAESGRVARYCGNDARSSCTSNPAGVPSAGPRRHAKQGIGHRFGERAQAERYRDRFLRGRRLATHQREVTSLAGLMEQLGEFDMVFDVASGTGRLTPCLAAHARSAVQIDSSLPMLEVSRECSADAKVLGQVQSDARALPLAESSCDLAFCHRLLNHLPDERDRRRILQELARVSRRFVTVSCLTPPAALRALRRVYAWLRGRPPVDGFVGTADLFGDADIAGLRLVARTPIRAGFRSAAFLTFEKV